MEAFVDDLQSSGRYTFSQREAAAALRSTRDSVRRAAQRLASRGRLSTPYRGFYVIVPLEYRSAGAPPASWFIDDLMRHLGKPYYVGVLTAAAIHGAAHQQPQEFQVVTSAVLRPMRAGRTGIRFLTRSHWKSPLTERTKVSTGFMVISTREATVFDLLRYQHAVGPVSAVATVLAQLADGLDARKLVAAAERDGTPAYIQRAGYLLDQAGADSATSHLRHWLAARQPRPAPLVPSELLTSAHLDPRWRVLVNAAAEPDL